MNLEKANFRTAQEISLLIGWSMFPAAAMAVATFTARSFSSLGGHFIPNRSLVHLPTQQGRGRLYVGTELLRSG